MNKEEKNKQYLEIINEEKEIKNELNKSGGIEKGFKEYYFLNKKWYEKYKNFLKEDKIDNNKLTKNLLNIKNIFHDKEDKDFSYINKKFNFDFPFNFQIVTKNFITLLSNNLDKIGQRIIQKLFFNIIIGGECLIIKDQNNSSKFNYITLYNKDEENFDNNINYILIIEDLEKMKEDINFILKNNIWEYFKKINYNYKDEYKEIKNSENKKIGYIILNSDPTYINKYEKIKNDIILKEDKNNLKELSKDKNDISNKKNLISHIRNKSANNYIINSIYKNSNYKIKNNSVIKDINNIIIDENNIINNMKNKKNCNIKDRSNLDNNNLKKNNNNNINKINNKVDEKEDLIKIKKENNEL